MRLFRLTLATIFQRKSWAVCLFVVGTFPFALPLISSATEKPILIQPARIQTAWACLWLCTLLWGLYTSAKKGESNARSGIGEYFQTNGTHRIRQLFEIWLATFCFIAPLVVLTILISHFGALPSDPREHTAWLMLNLQYGTLFVLVAAPLLALSASLASRFGGITGFSASLLLAVYGLYGVGYLDNMLKLEENPLLRALWTYSPQYRYADLTQRLYFKTGALPADAFLLISLYFLGILAVFAVISSLCFRAHK